MSALKPLLICLFIGLALGFIATLLFGSRLSFSPYFITIPAAYAPFFTGSLKLKMKDD